MKAKDLCFVEASLLQTSRLDYENLNNALKQLVKRHAHLQLRYSRKGGDKLIQFYSDKLEDSYYLEKLILTDNDSTNSEDVIRNYCEGLNEKLNLETGPILIVSLIQAPAIEENYLFVSVHRMIADRIAWRVLVTELHMLYTKEPLPEVAGVYKDWMGGLQAYSRTNTVQENHLGYWKMMMAKLEKMELPKKSQHDKEAKYLLQCIHDKEMQDLVSNLSFQYGIKPYDLLLSAVTYALNTIYQTDKISLTLSHHGRDPICKGVDSVRTIGYCQVEFPFIAELNSPISFTAMLWSISKQISALPQNGLSYTALSYFHQDPEVRTLLGARNLPLINYTHLGNFDQLGLNTGWNISEVYPGWRNGFSRRQYPASITSFVYDKELYIQLSYQEGYFSENQTQDILNKISQFIKGAATEIKNSIGLPFQNMPILRTHSRTFEPTVILSEGKANLPSYIILHPGDGGAESYLNALYPYLPIENRIVLFNNYLFQSGDLINLPQCFEELADFYISLLGQNDFANGVRLVGYSFGGILAYEMALQLEKKGIKVLDIYLIDPVVLSNMKDQSNIKPYMLKRSVRQYLAAYEINNKPNSNIYFFKADKSDFISKPEGIDGRIMAASKLPFNGLPLTDCNNLALYRIACDHYQLLTPPYADQIIEVILKDAVVDLNQISQKEKLALIRG